MSDDVRTLIQNITLVSAQTKFGKFQRTSLDIRIPEEQIRSNFLLEGFWNIFKVAWLDHNLLSKVLDFFFILLSGLKHENGLRE